MTNDPLATTCPDCGKPGRILSTCECGEFLSATLALDESANYDKAYPGGTCSYVERGWCNFTECVRDGCMGERIRSLSESVQMCDQAQKAALHAQEECLKAQDVCLGAQHGEREALRKRAESMDYAVAVTRLAQHWRDFLIEIVERTKPDGDMADAPVHSLAEAHMAFGLSHEHWERFEAIVSNRENEIGQRCRTCNGLGELPPRSSDPEDTAPSPPCPDCQRSHAVCHADPVRAAAERMVRTYRDWMAGCENETRWKEVEAAHINLRDTLANPVLSQYSLPQGAWVEHGCGWVKVHALQSTEAAKELCKFLESAQDSKNG